MKFDDKHLNFAPCMSRRTFIGGALACAAATSIGFVGCTSQTDDDTFHVAVSYDVDKFDLLKDAYPLIVSASWHVFEGLYHMGRSDGTIKPVIAEGSPVKVDNLVYEIKIDTSKKFSNGDKITLDDVYESLKSVLYDKVYAYLFDFVRKGEIDRNNNLLRLYLSYDVGSLLESRLSLLRIYKVIYENNQATAIYGSGPWAYESGNGNDNTELVFVANEYYKGNYPAKNKRMVWHINTDDDDRMNESLEKKYHVVEKVVPTKISTFESNGYNVSNLETYCMAMLAFNTASSPFNDIRVRQAILYAIDTNSLLTDIFAGYGKKATCILPEYSKYYARPSIVYNYNPSKVSELLTEAGLSRFKFDLVNYGGYWGNIVATKIATNLSVVGITCNIRQSDLDWNDYENATDQGDFEVALLRADSSYYGLDPDVVIEMFWGDGIGDWMTSWSQTDTAKWNELESLTRSAREANDSDRMTYWSKCYDLIAENVPCYPLFFKNIATAWLKDKVVDFSPTPLDGISVLGSSVT